MKLHWGAIPDSPNFNPEPPWQPLRWDPDPKWLQLAALPIALANVALFVWLWSFGKVDDFFPRLEGKWEMILFPLLMLVGLAAVIVVHEFIHMLVHPQSGRSDASVLGCWPRNLLFYAHYDGELSRERFLAILLMPFLVLSVLPLVLALLFPGLPGWCAMVSILNAAMACGDQMGVVIVALFVPTRARVRNKCWKTYWKIAG